MIEIDGSFGEGGGQILRSSVALSAITGKSVAITNIRANRAKPGLMRQHFAAISAAKDICDARAGGLELHSTALTFEPQEIRSGTYRFSIGTAGSTSLVLQTVLMPLLLADKMSTVWLKGGTHNPLAPSFDFIDKCFVPQINRMGANVTVRIKRHGFVPAGGGEIVAQINPVRQWCPLKLLERGDLQSRLVRAVSGALPQSIAHRELKRIHAKTDWPWSELCGESVSSGGPGNAVMIDLQYKNVGAHFTGFGKIGRRAEAVATDAWNEAQLYLDSEAPVCEHLADQLLLPMAIAADRENKHSKFVTHVASSHTRTHMELIQKFMNVSIDATEHAEDRIEISVGPA